MTRCCGHSYINGAVYVHGSVAKSLQLMQLIGQLLKIVICSADINKAIKHEQWIRSYDPKKTKRSRSNPKAAEL